MVYQLVLCLLRGLALREFSTHHTTLTKLYLENFEFGRVGVAHFPGVCLSSMACTLFYVPHPFHDRSCGNVRMTSFFRHTCKFKFGDDQSPHPFARLGYLVFLCLCLFVLSVLKSTRLKKDIYYKMLIYLINTKVIIKNCSKKYTKRDII